jgi:hypothetical protein
VRGSKSTSFGQQLSRVSTNDGGCHGFDIDSKGNDKCDNHANPTKQIIIVAVNVNHGSGSGTGVRGPFVDIIITRIGIGIGCGGNDIHATASLFLLERRVLPHHLQCMQQWTGMNAMLVGL